MLFSPLLQPSSTPLAFNDNKPVFAAELAEKVKIIAANLNNNPHSTYAIYCNNTFVFLMALLALLLTDKKCVLLPNNNPDFIDSIRNNFDVYLDDDGVLALSQATSFTLPELKDKTNYPEIVFFTSGSTGIPKAIHKNLHHLLAEVNILNTLWGQQTPSVFISSVSHQHLYGLLFRCLWPYLSQQPFMSEPLRFAEQLPEMLNVYDSVFFISSPALLHRLPTMVDLNSQQHRFARVTSSGGVLQPNVAAQWQAILGHPILEIMGSTETGGFAWREGGADNHWRLFPDTLITVEDTQLTLHSPFLPTPYLLDDKGTIDDNGHLHFEGRRDRIVKIEGKRVSLNELEQRLSTHPAIEFARIVTLNTPREITAAVLVITPQGKRDLQAQGRRLFYQSITQQLVGYFDRVVIPKKWRIVDELPCNEMGKTSIDALTQLFKSYE